MKVRNTEFIYIENFDELLKIADEEYSSACSLDLLLMRDGFMLADGFLLLCQCDCSTHSKLYFITFDIYRTLSKGEREYIKRHYGVYINI